MTSEEKTARRKKTSSLRKQIITAFLIFTAVVLVLLWVSQTILLRDIYRFMKLRTLEYCADLVVESVDDGYDEEKIKEAAQTYSKKNAVCISVYEIAEDENGKKGSLIADCHANTFCFIHNLRDSEWLNRLYRKALSEEGEHDEWISLSSMFGQDAEEQDTGKNVVLTRVVEADGHELLFLFNSELIPLNATVDTLRLMLAVISVILVAVAVVLTLLLSNSLSKPIREMSKEASKLALGDYNVNFTGGNCTETAALSSTLNGAANELSKLDRMQKDLIANVSHDLRTPLTMIAGYTEAMRDLPGEATAENMQIVIDETKRLSDLVGDMMEISKYQSGTVPLTLEVFNFTDVIRTTLERYAKLREKDGYEIRFEADCDVFVRADEGRILQVLYNLINNAVNYTGDDKLVAVRQTVTEKDVLLEVIDTGCGIPEDQLPLVWERYYKVHDFHKRANMGTGLGLSIVKNILVLHGAEFGVTSEVGHGSTFWFKLPREE